ncbi:hypothetical protein M1116_03030 [Patescibacteria group bacterium]|nr:hypothetical protein [Patescibacteria group bacterium]
MTPPNNESSSDTSGSFLMGLVFGAVIAAIAAIVIYRRRDTQIVQELKKKLNSYFTLSATPEPKVSRRVRRVKKKSAAARSPSHFFKKTAEHIV